MIPFIPIDFTCSKKSLAALRSLNLVTLSGPFFVFAYLTSKGPLASSISGETSIFSFFPERLIFFFPATTDSACSFDSFRALIAAAIFFLRLARYLSDLSVSPSLSISLSSFPTGSRASSAYFLFKIPVFGFFSGVFLSKNEVPFLILLGFFIFLAS